MAKSGFNEAAGRTPRKRGASQRSPCRDPASMRPRGVPRGSLKVLAAGYYDIKVLQ